MIWRYFWYFGLRRVGWFAVVWAGDVVLGVFYLRVCRLDLVDADLGWVLGSPGYCWWVR